MQAGQGFSLWRPLTPTAGSVVLAAQSCDTCAQLPLEQGEPGAQLGGGRTRVYMPAMLLTTNGPCGVQVGPCDMVVTSVAGHLLELDFVPPYNKWHGCEARALYDAPVAKTVPKVGGGRAGGGRGGGREGQEGGVVAAASLELFRKGQPMQTLAAVLCPCSKHACQLYERPSEAGRVRGSLPPSELT